jgi:hypothetical protein
MLFYIGQIYAFDRYINWLRSVFKQAETGTINATCARSYLRSIAVYDHFATVTMVDALMISSPVLETYAQLYAERRGWGPEQEEQFLQTQYSQNKDILALYLLIKPARYGPTVSATNPYACWIPSLFLEGVTYQPQVVKTVRLEPEFHYIFGRHFSAFREVYYITFAIGQQKRDRVMVDTIPLQLTFRSAHYVVHLAW